MKNTTDTKKRIYYIREYRHFDLKGSGIALFLLLCVLPVTVVMLLSFSAISRWICDWAGPLLSNVLGAEIGTQEHFFIPILEPVTSLTLNGHDPGRTQTILVLIVSIIIILLCRKADGGLRSVFIYLSMASWILLASCLFFLIWPGKFPYTLSEFSSLYMLQQATMCIIMPAILGVALSLLPTNFVLKYLAVLVCCAVDVLFSAVRYVFYLYVLVRFSHLYMASLYFSLGVLFDFIRMALIFAFAAKRVSKTMQTPEWRGKWDWG